MIYAYACVGPRTLKQMPILMGQPVFSGSPSPEVLFSPHLCLHSGRLKRVLLEYPSRCGHSMKTSFMQTEIRPPRRLFGLFKVLYAGGYENPRN